MKLLKIPFCRPDSPEVEIAAAGNVRMDHKPLCTDSDGLKVGSQFRNWRQLSRYKGKLFRAIEEGPIRDLIGMHVWIKRGCGDPGAVSPNWDYGSTPASFTLSESAIECDNALSSTLAVDGVPYRRDCRKRQVSQGKRRREDFTQVVKDRGITTYRPRLSALASHPVQVNWPRSWPKHPDCPTLLPLGSRAQRRTASTVSCPISCRMLDRRCSICDRPSSRRLASAIRRTARKVAFSVCCPSVAIKGIFQFHNNGLAAVSLWVDRCLFTSSEI
jgi:hypothetical protein